MINNFHRLSSGFCTIRLASFLFNKLFQPIIDGGKVVRLLVQLSCIRCLSTDVITFILCFWFLATSHERRKKKLFERKMENVAWTRGNVKYTIGSLTFAQKTIARRTPAWKSFTSMKFARRFICPVCICPKLSARNVLRANVFWTNVFAGK
jgi:hypothetical protein